MIVECKLQVCKKGLIERAKGEKAFCDGKMMVEVSMKKYRARCSCYIGLRQYGCSVAAEEEVVDGGSSAIFCFDMFME